MNCALIGTSKIASIHLKEILKDNFKKIYLISRKKKTAREFLVKNNFYDERINISSKKILKDKIDLIDICVTTNLHHVFLDYLKKSNSFIIIEKPLISINIFKNDIPKKIDKIFNKHKKLVTCNPMTYFGNSFIKLFKSNLKKDINNIEIYYHVKGVKLYNEIAIDLLTHIINFLDVILLFKKIKIESIEKKIKKVNKNNWLFIGTINKKIKIKISLKEYENTNISTFYFKINKDKYFRKTKLKDKKFINFLSFKNKIIKIQNPMTKFLRTSLKNRNNLSFIKKNQLLTKKTMLIKKILLQI